MSKLDTLASLLGPPSDVPPSEPEKPIRDMNPEALAARKAARIAQCGWKIKKTDAVTGTGKTVPRFCRDSGCEYCNTMRGNDLKERVKSALEEHKLHLVYLPNTKETGKLLAKLGKENYIRIPGEERDTVFVNADHRIGADLGRPFHYFSVNSMDWTTLATATADRKSSGTMAREAEYVPSTGENVITFTEYTIVPRRLNSEGEKIAGPTDEEMEQADYEALVETIDLNPQTDFELEACLVKLAYAYQNAFTKMGFQKVTMENITITKERFLYNWITPRDNVRRRVLLEQAEKAGLEAKAA